MRHQKTSTSEGSGDTAWGDPENSVLATGRQCAYSALIQYTALLSVHAILKNQNFRSRLAFALAGLRLAWRRERSVRTHVFMTGLALLALIVLRPEPVWWALVGLAIAMVLSAELFNAALETLADHVRPEFHDDIKIVKDIAAGGVLIAAIAALWIAAFLILSFI